MKIGIQGKKGSFHHQVASNYFGENFELVECDSFSDMPKLFCENKVDTCIMAIENSTVGTILPNYSIIDTHNLSICGEYILSIEIALMALPNQNTETIKEVYSHPMALLQCSHYFEQFPHIKLIEDFDTAGVSKRIAEKKLTNIGALASKDAAKMYGLEIIAPKIQNVKNNATRFLIITKEDTKNTNVMANKASLKLIVSDEAGSLVEILSVFKKHQLNLTKIQSIPIIESQWKNAFFIDTTFQKYPDYYNTLKEITPLVKGLKVLGEYTKYNKG